LDTWSDLYQGNASQFNEIRFGLRPLKRIAQKYKCCVIIIHHTVKYSENTQPNKNRVNGSQAIEATLRSVLELRNLDDGKSKCLSVVKGNFISTEFKKTGLILDFEEEHLQFSTDKESIDIGGLGSDGRNRKYSDPLVKDELLRLKKEQNLSFENCRRRLVQQFGETNVPRMTRLKNWFSESVGQSKPIQSDRLTKMDEPTVEKDPDDPHTEKKSDQTSENPEQ
jgi:hypothetical protein